jgi:hypothetical protein
MSFDTAWNVLDILDRDHSLKAPANRLSVLSARTRRDSLFARAAVSGVHSVGPLTPADLFPLPILGRIERGLVCPAVGPAIPVTSA